MINTLKDAAFDAWNMAEEILYDFDSFEALIILFGEEFSVIPEESSIERQANQYRRLYGVYPVLYTLGAALKKKAEALKSLSGDIFVKLKKKEMSDEQD